MTSYHEEMAYERGRAEATAVEFTSFLELRNAIRDRGLAIEQFRASLGHLLLQGGSK